MASEGTPEGSAAYLGLPLYIALVDLTGGDEWMELVKSGLLAVIEALPSFCLFGIAVYSDRVGLMDMRSEVPFVRFVHAPKSTELELGLEEALPFSKFMVQVGTGKENIQAAIESLSLLLDRGVAAGAAGAGSFDAGSPAGGAHQPRIAGKRQPKRAFGSAVHGLLEYFAANEGFASCRVLTFMAGIPNYGLGALDAGRITALASAGDQVISPAGPFYRTLAEQAVGAGVCFDLFVISNGYTDLATVKFLATKTGGKLMLYESTVNCTLPQDMYRQLSRPQAAQGLLRIRTSQEFRAAEYYGNVFADPTYANLFHLVGCDDFACVAVDFEFEDSTGFAVGSAGGPIVQLAFAYTCVTAAENDAELPVVRRRLRIHTVRLEASHNVKDLYRSAQPDVVMAVLAQKITRAALDDGVAEARALLQDWLAILLARFNEATKADRARGELALTFDGYETLVHLPRYVYGLLRHPVLSSDNVHPDERIFLQTLFASLQPHFLLNSIYPTLSSFHDENTPGEAVLVLANTEVATSVPGIFLMDSFNGVHVYYRDQAAEPFPATQGSVLRSKVAELKQDRPITPLVTWSKAGMSEARFVVAGLIEDSPGSDMPYNMFLEAVRASVRKIARI